MYCVLNITLALAIHNNPYLFFAPVIICIHIFGLHSVSFYHSFLRVFPFYSYELFFSVVRPSFILGTICGLYSFDIHIHMHSEKHNMIISTLNVFVIEFKNTQW